ncbi:MAG: CvpA family protein [Caulobacterales bacterium]|nr:CvpA family protein [Caulobacterales bacterium]
MADVPITGFDLAVIGLLLISGVIGFARGFVRETLMIAAFLAAALAALWGAPPLWPAATAAIPITWVAQLVVVVAVFLAVYIGVTMITSSITSLLHGNNRIGLFDRILGLGFGVARGVVIAALSVLIYNLAISRTQHPAWLTEAQSYPLVFAAADMLQAAFPPATRIAARALPPVE